MLRIFVGLLAGLSSVLWADFGSALAQEPDRLGARLAAGQPIPPAELEAFIDGVVGQAIAEDHIVGVSVSVVQDGQVALKKGYGFADLEARRRVDPDSTLFRIGSITKTFTWIAVMNQIAAGRIALDDPVNDHLPAELQIPDQGFAEPIRIRHLMTHSPGFEDRALGVLFANDPARIRPLTDFLRETRPDRVREAGAISSYSNYGAALAGESVAHTQGRLWQEIIESEILGPLGMSHTSTREPYPARADLPAPMPDSLARDLSKSYRWTGAGHEARVFEYLTQIAPAGVMSASGGDIARYMMMLLNNGSLDGVTVFGPDAAKAFRTPMTSFPPLLGNWDAGFREAPLPGGFTGYGHDGATLTVFSNMTIVPQLRLGIFISANTEGGSGLTGALVGRVIERFYAPLPVPIAGSPDLVKSATTYRGQYHLTRRAYSGLQGFLFRLATVRVAVTPDGYLTLQAIGDVQRFVPTDVPGEFKQVDGQGGMTFKMDGDRATRIDLASIAFERVGPLSQVEVLMIPAVLALLASFATLIGFFVRLGRDRPKTRVQAIAATLQTAAAAFWIVSAAALGVFVASVADQQNLIFNWPTPPIVAFSAAGLTASLLTVASLVLVPAVWRGAPRTEGWTAWRKLRFTMTAVSFGVLAVVLALWGALQPWNP